MPPTKTGTAIKKSLFVNGDVACGQQKASESAVAQAILLSTVSRRGNQRLLSIFFWKMGPIFFPKRVLDIFTSLLASKEQHKKTT